MKNNDASLISGFINNVKQHPNNLALIIHDQEFTYADLMARVLIVADLIRPIKTSSDYLIGIITNRSLASFTGILGLLYTGAGYVPFNSQT
jgi:tyrocidine synthetase-3